jgi:hypothetical protein
MKKVLAQDETTKVYNPKVDHNKIKSQIILIQIMKVFRLIMIIFTMSYFIGAIWYFFTKYTSKWSEEQTWGSVVEEGG